MAISIENVKAMLAQKPRAPLGFFPTPFYKLDAMSRELGINLYIKRDDFTGMSLFGGNKVRKLEYLIGDAAAKGCEYIFTYGATQSNHAMQTVTACRRCGLKPVIYLVAIVPVKESDIRSNLLLDKIMDAEVHIVDMKDGETEAEAEARSFEMGAMHIARLEAEGKKCYNVPMGGASHIGSAGFVGGFAEFAEQIAESKLDVGYIFHSTGTGGTMAGLNAGKKLLGYNMDIVSVSASPKTESYAAEKAALANETLEYLGSEMRLEAEDFHVDLDYWQPGYEQPSEPATEAIKLMAVKEGLLLDPVYSGKAFAGLIGHVRDGRIKQGSNVVFWHTGGATALFAEQEILGKIF